MDRKLLIEIIFDQKNFNWDINNLSRSESLFRKKSNQIEIISGIRRCGKSTVLNEIRYKNKEKDYYLNFDDDRLLHFTVKDFQLLYELFIELFGEQNTFYFDEIQNVEGWERFVRRLHDYNKKVYLTGSNATLLSSELGTRLTGRYISHELFPFSFAEFLMFRNVQITNEKMFSTNGKAEIKRHFFKYMETGGFPEFLKTGNKDYLKFLYESILYRDILVRNKLINEKEMRELVLSLTSNLSKLITYNSLSKLIGVQNAATVKKYLQYLENSYLVFQVNKYASSVKKQIYSPKKTYFIDNALASVLGFRFSDDRRRYLENLVFVEMKRRGYEMYYHKGSKECDFILRENNKIVSAVQVTLSLNHSKTKDREISGLIEAMEFYNLNSGIILTEDEEDIISAGGKEIKILPVWKWLLTNLF
jgi:predicted AAA+ superfamily ATPase